MFVIRIDTIFHKLGESPFKLSEKIYYFLCAEQGDCFTEYMSHQVFPISNGKGVNYSARHALDVMKMKDVKA